MKLVKEYHRRLRYLKSRLRDMPLEQKFAEGKITTLPTSITPMPKWAIAAAIAGSEGATKPIAHLKPKPGQNYDVHNLIELLGYFQAMVLYVQNPSTETTELEKEAPGLSPIRTKLNKQVAKAFLRFWRRIRRKKREPQVMLTAEELIKRHKSFIAGMRDFAAPDGRMQGFKMLTTRANFLIWMFRHELEGHFTAPYVHAWLRKEHNESLSDSLVEAIVTKLRKGPMITEQP